MNDMFTTRIHLVFGRTQLEDPPKSTDLGNSSGGALAQAIMRLMIVLAALSLGGAVTAQETATVRYTVDPSKVENTVDVGIYGQCVLARLSQLGGEIGFFQRC